jgi:hypothetical protein
MVSCLCILHVTLQLRDSALGLCSVGVTWLAEHNHCKPFCCRRSRDLTEIVSDISPYLRMLHSQYILPKNCTQDGEICVDQSLLLIVSSEKDVFSPLQQACSYFSGSMTFGPTPSEARISSFVHLFSPKRKWLHNYCFSLSYLGNH